MADKTIVDRECTNEFGETRLVIFALLQLNKIKCSGNKSGGNIGRKRNPFYEQRGLRRSRFLLRDHLNLKHTASSTSDRL